MSDDWKRDVERRLLELRRDFRSLSNWLSFFLLLLIVLIGALYGWTNEAFEGTRDRMRIVERRVDAVDAKANAKLDAIDASANAKLDVLIERKDRAGRP